MALTGQKKANTADVLAFMCLSFHKSRIHAMPNSISSYPTCESCIYLDMSYQGEGPDYGVCRHNRKAYKDYANGVPMMVCPVIHPTNDSCAYYCDGSQPELPIGEGDRLIKKMLAASLEISTGNPSVDKRTLKTGKAPRYNCEKRSWGNYS